MSSASLDADMIRYTEHIWFNEILSICRHGVPRFVVIALTWAVLAGTCSAQQTFDAVVLPFVQKHCIRCHGSEEQEGDFRLDQLKRDFDSPLAAELWAELIGRINAGEMPPEDEPQPAAGEIESVVDWIGARIKEGERARMAKRASVAFYRLSREEFSNTVHDLLGVHYDAAAPGQMTPDAQWHGFERIGSQLSLSPSHVEKYLKAARKVLDAAYPDKQPQSTKWKKDAIDLDWPNRSKRELLREAGIEDQVRTLIWPGHKLSYVEPAHINYDMPPGMYRAKLKLSGLKPKNGRPPHVTIYCKQLDRMLFEQDVIARKDEPVVLEFEAFLAGKIAIMINNEVPGPSNSPSPNRPCGHTASRTIPSSCATSKFQPLKNHRPATAASQPHSKCRNYSKESDRAEPFACFQTAGNPVRYRAKRNKTRSISGLRCYAGNRLT